MSLDVEELSDEELRQKHEVIAREARASEYGEDRKKMTELQLELEEEMRERGMT